MSTRVELIQSNGVARVRFGSESGIQLLDAAVRGALKEILATVAADPATRVVVFEASGRTFLAGADIHELRSLSRRTARKYSRAGQRLFQRIADLPCLSVAAIHAACAGGGCELALACDIRLAAAGAKIGLPEVTLGLVPGWGGTARARVMLGLAAATRVVLSGELFPAAAAQSLGLVHEVLPDEGFPQAVDERITQWLRAAPGAVASAKFLLDRPSRRTMRNLLNLESREFAECYNSDEAAEGIAAFLEKRAANWVN